MGNSNFREGLREEVAEFCSWLYCSQFNSDDNFNYLQGKSKIAS